MIAQQLKDILKDPARKLCVGFWIEELRSAQDGASRLVYMNDGEPTQGLALFESGYVASYFLRQAEQRYFKEHAVLVYRDTPDRAFVLGPIDGSMSPWSVKGAQSSVRMLGQSDVIELSRSSPQVRYVGWSKPAVDGSLVSQQTWNLLLWQLGGDASAA